ncbi:hypothetical protein [Amycolatopsis tolypomycina]|uniref:hypothetical protein n=1 Tax=Amycolatopsis tolypomycina TaxID=208445 RepID=UPI0033BB1EFA
MTTLRLAGIGALGLLLTACGSAVPPTTPPTTTASRTSATPTPTPTAATAHSLSTVLGEAVVTKLDAIGSVLASCVPDLPRCYPTVAVLRSGIAEAQARIKAAPDAPRYADALRTLDETGRRAETLQGCEAWFAGNGAVRGRKNAGCSGAFDEAMALLGQFRAMY